MSVSLQESPSDFSSHRLSSRRGNLPLSLPGEEVRVRYSQGSLGIERTDGGQRENVRGKRTTESGLLGTTSPHSETVTFPHRFRICCRCCRSLTQYSKSLYSHRLSDRVTGTTLRPNGLHPGPKSQAERGRTQKEEGAEGYAGVPHRL